MVYVAIATDLMGDGLLIGADSAVSRQLAFSLALARVLAEGAKRGQRLLLSASFAVPVLGAGARRTRRLRAFPGRLRRIRQIGNV